MKLSEELQSKLKKIYEPSAVISLRFKGNDVLFKTDDEGNPILLFVGKKDSTGKIKGDRYARSLKRDEGGKIFKDHWERKGKAT
jgi:hypothetical protein